MGSYQILTKLFCFSWTLLYPRPPTLLRPLLLVNAYLLSIFLLNCTHLDCCLFCPSTMMFSALLPCDESVRGDSWNPTTQPCLVLSVPSVCVWAEVTRWVASNSPVLELEPELQWNYVVRRYDRFNHRQSLQVFLFCVLLEITHFVRWLTISWEKFFPMESCLCGRWHDIHVRINSTQ